MRTEVYVALPCILHQVLLLSDLFEPEYHPPKTLTITSLEISFLIPEWLSFMLCDYLGAYSSAARTLRWIYESALASAVATLDGSLLLGGTPKSLTKSQFRKWLWKYDHQKMTNVSFPRKNALRVIGLPSMDQTRYIELYSTLCKFSHVSEKHFVHPEPIPDLVFNLKQFDAVSRYAYKTMDLAFFCVIKAILSQWHSDDVNNFFHGYLGSYSARQIYSVRRDRFPLTIGLLKGI